MSIILHIRPAFQYLRISLHKLVIVSNPLDWLMKTYSKSMYVACSVWEAIQLHNTHVWGFCIAQLGKKNRLPSKPERETKRKRHFSKHRSLPYNTTFLRFFVMAVAAGLEYSKKNILWSVYQQAGSDASVSVDGHCKPTGASSPITAFHCLSLSPPFYLELAKGESEIAKINLNLNLMPPR